MWDKISSFFLRAFLFLPFLWVNALLYLSTQTVHESVPPGFPGFLHKISWPNYLSLWKLKKSCGTCAQVKCLLYWTGNFTGETIKTVSNSKLSTKNPLTLSVLVYSAAFVPVTFLQSAGGARIVAVAWITCFRDWDSEITIKTEFGHTHSLRRAGLCLFAVRAALRLKILPFLNSIWRGPNVNCVDSTGYTPLHHAALNGHR